MKKKLYLLLALLLAAAVIVTGALLLIKQQETAVTAPETPVLKLADDLSVYWDRVENAQCYIIEVNGSDLASIEGTTFPALSASGTYTIRVRSVNQAGKSDYSNEVSYQILSVTLPHHELYTVLGNPSVGYGKDYTFSLELAEGCTQCKPVVKVNGQVVTPDAGGKYTVESVTEELTVTVEGVELNAYGITLPTGTGYTLSGEPVAYYGKDYTFTLTLDERYSKSQPVVKANGVELTLRDGSYVIENVTKPQSITVTGVSLNIYTVNLTTGRGYQISPSGVRTVSYGGSITFTVTPASPSYGITVKADGKTLFGDSGTYTISNVTSNVRVTVTVSGLPALSAVEKILDPKSWNAGSATPDGDSLIVSASSVLKASYLRDLWAEGYTHLVFTVNAKAVDNMNYTHGGEWSRYWANFDAAKDVDIRIDLNEFHDGDTWHSLNFNSGNMTVSNPRAYKSAETLGWTKSRTNIYFAVEDGYYVLETRANDDSVTSPTQWLKKYVVADDASQRSWLMYTDYLKQGSNTRSMLWGWGSAVNTINGNVNGGWSWNNNVQTDGYTDGEVFSLHLDHSGTARFKLLDWVSNRNGWNEGVTFAYIDEQTFQFSTDLNGHVFRLASTNELVEMGYKALEVTLTGNLGENILWYGNGDWNGGMHDISANKLSNGSYTFRVELSELEGELFQLHASVASGAITDMQVTVRPAELGTPVKVHQVTLPAGEGFTATGRQNVRHGESYSFAVDLMVGYDSDKVVVKANGKELTQKDGLYTIDAVTEDVTVTVEQVQLIRYPVTLPANRAFQVVGNSYAEYGRDYTFKIVMNEGYTGRQAMIFVNGQAVAPVNGEYVVKSVKNALTVTAELSENNSWVVLIPDGSRYTVTPSGKQNVLDKESLTFTVTPNADDAKVTVTANGKVLTGEGGVYTLRNVQENIIVEISANTLVDEAMLAENWLSNSAVQTQDDLTLAANPSLKAEYLKSLWDAGYTHLVFTMNASTGGNFIHGGTWDHYWGGFSAGTRDVRIDLNEFCVDNTWYDLSFINMSGDMTVREPRAYKSAETLGWTKSRTNIYFAIEDGYYVLETRANDDYVTSPTQWLKKYVVKDDASQRSWLMYTDYLNQGSNTRSMLWGWGSAVNIINDHVNGGWSWNNNVQTDGYTDGEVFTLHLDHGGTARFKLLDWVSNRNGWNSSLSISYVDAQTIRWSAAEGYKLRLATTQDLIAAGYTTLQVTLTGDLGSALIWYGDDDWSDGEIAVGADRFVDGSYTFEVDLTAFTSDETFTLLANAAEFTDLLVKIEPVTKTAYSVSLPTGLGYRVQGEPAAYQGSSYSFTLTLDEGYTQSSALVKVNGVHLDGTDGIYTVENVQEDLTITVEGIQLNTYTVTKAEGEGFTISGADSVTHGASYTFQVVLDDPNTQLVVLVNGSAVTGTNGSYTVERVTANLTITVQATLPEPDFPESVILNTASWTAASLNEDGSLSTGAGTQLSSTALKQLWDEGYTHLIFTVNAKAASDNNTNYTHSGTWSRYWSTFDAAKDVDIRIDLNEFHDGDSWYSLNFNSGNMTVSNPRAYKSAETLNWTKSRTNIYFAIEDGYYVLETRANDDYVTSPTQWLKKYVVKDDASQRSWLMYTDYLNQGSNTRSMLWGWGSAVNVINGDVNGGWSWNNNVQTDGYTDGEVFSLHLDHKGTARFKLLDWVSNRNGWNSSLSISYVDAQTIRWSAADGYKLRLATTQDLIADGYTTLRVTLTGDLGSALVWYGDDDWSDGEIAVGAEKFVDGSYTFEVDLTAFRSNETFTLLANAADITDLLVKIEPVQGDNPAVIYNVTAPTGEGYTFTGAETVLEGTNYSFTVMPNDGVTVTVKVNGKVINGENGSYTVENVTSNLVITVETKALTTVKKLLTANNWSNGGTVGDGTLIVPASSSLKDDYLKALWDEGYTHLVFTVNAKAASDNNTNYTHSGTWSRYWKNFDAAKDVDIRIDLNEFHDGDSWYNLNFNSGNMTVSNPRAYKSAETLSWTKNRTNIYFAIEDGYYVLETWANDDSVTSPTQWLKKYVVADDASQRSWLMYTDYLNQGSNTRSMLWGWGSAVNTINGNVNGGWSWINNVQTDGYTDGEVFSLHLDHNGTARFKLLDWVSNRNEWAPGISISYVDAQTIRWSASNDYKLRLATTQDLIADGYTTLKVTLTGNLGSALIWYGDDDWGDGEIAVGADKFVDGSYTFEVDLTAFNSDETFTLLANTAAFTDMLVKIEPVGKPEQYAVKLIPGNGYSLDGKNYAVAGQDYSFRLTTDTNVTLGTVTVNDVAYTAVDGVYTVPAAAVTGSLVIRVESVAISNAIVISNESYTATASLLESELEAVSGSYSVCGLDDNANYTNCIMLGTNTEDANVTAETYRVSGDGTNIYIDGNCKRAVAYGAADFLRSLGYEFYTADVTTRPAGISLNFGMAELTDTADFAVRSYMSEQTSYNSGSVSDQAFTVLSKNNNALVADFSNYGGGVELEDFDSGVHNFEGFFADHTEGKYGYTVSTGVGSETGFAPCLTNGITYNVGGEDTTLTYAVARMKEAILANPDTYYYSFCQNDGNTWYCNCEHCTSDASSHNRSGTLVNFINAMIAQLEADPELSGRDFKIVTFAYSFTAQAPSNVASLSDKLQVLYAQWHNANYSINSDSQDLYNYKENLRAWADLTADGNLALWLYDTSFQNYLAYFPSVKTIASNIAEAKALGVSNILVQGSWNADYSWEAEMKAYIWSKLLWDSSLNVDTLQQNFLKAYFGDAAYSSVKTFVGLYDNNVGSAATVSKGYPICSGYGYFCYRDVYKQSTVHSKAIDAANAALAAIAADSSLSEAQKAVYTKRANALLATVYGSVIGNWSGYEKWHDAILGSDRFDNFETYFGATVAECQAKLTAALDAAGITKTSEYNMSVSEWLDFITNRYNTAG